MSTVFGKVLFQKGEHPSLCFIKSGVQPAPRAVWVRRIVFLFLSNFIYIFLYLSFQNFIDNTVGTQTLWIRIALYFILCPYNLYLKFFMMILTQPKKRKKSLKISLNDDSNASLMKVFFFFWLNFTILHRRLFYLFV